MKFFGKVGFIIHEETAPGVWTEKVTEGEYYGDVNRVSKRFESSTDKLNEDLNVNNEISIVADAFATQNFQQIRYVEWMGVKWEVPSVTLDPDRPRLTLTVGGVYNGEQA